MTIIVCLNPPQLATVSACFGAVRALNSFVEQQHSYQSKQQWHIHLDFPDFPDFFFFFSLRCPHQTKTQWRATREDVLDNHLFRSFFFLSHRRFKRGTLWANKLWTAFPLRQPHNGLPVHRRSSQRTLWLARKICLHLLSHTKKGHGRVPEMTHALTFTIESVSLTDKSSVQTVLYKN